MAADLIEQGRAATDTSGGTTENGMSESTATLHRTDEPAPPSPPLNRHQRRRLTALARQGLRHAA